MCCAGGKVSLPPLLEPPSYLLDLHISSSSESSSFRKNIRAYIKFCYGRNREESSFQNIQPQPFGIEVASDLFNKLLDT
ncbi:hypothetical protein RhiirA4_550680 [Rhizophagus irregularis]|uniref:Uncharacterized protein n=1 Tax=Rhizophagus irregularis TaxID=588596 RepID=A0A2I1HNQ0_9GLOM|nr:hypothetical protein RhiirA4_550680 [Rhizophagus irregularis]